MSRRAARIGDVVEAIAEKFPPEWAEEWDRVGLLAGDPQAEVTGVVCALDPARRCIAEAVSRGANLLVTHHPAFLTPLERVGPGPGSAGIVFDALSAGVALLNAHTNLDRSPLAGPLLGDRLGLQPLSALERAPMPMTVVTTYVPAEHAQAVIDAMAEVGAGRIGNYERCTFTSAAGSGTFEPLADASPAVGTAGRRTAMPEVAVVMVAPRAKSAGVLAAAREAHPYEEPLVSAEDVLLSRASARMGMLCRPSAKMRLAELADAVRDAFKIIPRVWGDPEREIGLAATATGSAGFLIADSLAAGAEVLIAGEVRYHDAMAAVDAGLSVIEMGHDVSEWPLVHLLRDAVISVPGIDRSRVHVVPAVPGWWTP